MNAVVEDLELPEGGDTAMGWERGIAWVRVGVVAMVRRVVVERRRAREPERRDLDLDLDLVRTLRRGWRVGSSARRVGRRAVWYSLISLFEICAAIILVVERQRREGTRNEVVKRGR